MEQTMQTVRQVSQNYGISARMLRYYEQAGLLESSRIDDYAYRVYDPHALNRLQQILILRKLQIPIKQIRQILSNQDAVETIEIFKQNINELEDKITALSTLKTILARFVSELQQKANVHLKLNLLNDKSMISLVDSLPIPISRVEEQISMGQLSKASETLNKYTDSKVRVVHIPPMTVVSGQLGQVKKFMDEVNLLNIKPDTRIFGCNENMIDGGEQNNKSLVETSDLWVSIPDDLCVPTHLEKRAFYGGLYAACQSYPDDFEKVQEFNEWLDNNGVYESNNGPDGIHRCACQEYFNAFNRHELNDDFSKKFGYTYFEFLEPIQEIAKPTQAEAEKMYADLAALELSFASKTPTVIDLSTMTDKIKDSDLVSHMDKNALVLYKGEGWEGNKYVSTNEHFTYPIKITLRATTNKEAICLSCAGYTIILKWIGSNEMLVASEFGEWKHHRKAGALTLNEFADIEWLIGKSVMAVKVNGELRHICAEYNYIHEYKNNPHHIMSGPVSVGTENESTVTVESLQVTEM